MQGLPQEVWLNIMRYLPAPDLCSLGLVCRTFYVLANDDSLWHRFSQARNGCYVPPSLFTQTPSSMSTKFVSSPSKYKPNSYPLFSKQCLATREYKRRGVTTVHLGLLGDEGTGKSAITAQFITGKFTEEAYDPTIEDTYRMIIQVDNTQVMVELLDTASPGMFSAMRSGPLPSMLREGYGIVFSLISPSTLDTASDFIEQIVSVKDIDPEQLGKPECNTSIILVGNKSDLVSVDDQQYLQLQEKAIQLGKKWCVPYIETSAKTKKNITALFNALVRLRLQSLHLRHKTGTATNNQRKGCLLM
jgi:small GTP-binding protein